jgi:hypothetical protein
MIEKERRSEMIQEHKSVKILKEDIDARYYSLRFNAKKYAIYCSPIILCFLFCSLIYTYPFLLTLLLLSITFSFYSYKPLKKVIQYKNIRKTIPKKKKEFILQRDGNICQECSATIVALEIDHKFPIVSGGGNELKNLQSLCKACNSKKWKNYKFIQWKEYFYHIKNIVRGR